LAALPLDQPGELDDDGAGSNMDSGDSGTHALEAILRDLSGDIKLLPETADRIRGEQNPNTDANSNPPQNNRS
jgi:hypothetical protein